MNIMNTIVPDIIPKAYCINLDRHPQHFQDILRDWSDILDIERVSAVDAHARKISGRDALRTTTLNLLSKIVREHPQSPFAIVMEDDVYKTQHFDISLWRKILDFVQSPSNASSWDMFTLDPLLTFDNVQLRPVYDFLFKISSFRSTGFMIYNVQFLKKHLHEISKCPGPLDMSMAYKPQYRKMTARVLMVRQRTDKGSSTSGNPTTAHYDKLWDQTEEILQRHLP